MDNDDVPIGRILTRREAVELLGITGVGLFAGWKATTNGLVSVAQAETLSRFTIPDSSALACVVRPEATEGPYFVDHQLNRSDVRAEPSTGKLSPGIPLDVTFNVASVTGQACKPIAGAMVDMWHCDAEGVYSGVDDRGFNTIGKKFLRGFQTTDANGMAKFASVYPGWYQGRTVHYHFKIRTTGADNKAYEFTSQLFFDDALSDSIFEVAPYKRDAVRDTRNNNDMFLREVGDALMLKLDKKGKGYGGTFNIGLDLANAETGKPDGMGAGGPGRGGPPGGPGGRGRGGPPPDGRGRGFTPPRRDTTQRGE